MDAVIAGKRVCLRSGTSCSKRLDGQYQSYWFRCRSGRLARVPSAGKIVASIPAPAVGGLAIGAGAVWVANMNPRTVTRIDPATNAVVATIALGEPDFLWGPTRLAFGHGSLWATDGMSSSVFRIDPEANRVTATIPLGSPTQFSTGTARNRRDRRCRLGREYRATEEPTGSVVREDESPRRRVHVGASVTPPQPPLSDTRESSASDARP